jgi:carbonic anhydrase/acetyltransferase-like protein (isoleucine patch superfamily)
MVGAGAVVAAAALIREDMAVPPGALAVGVPAAIREDAGLRQREWIARAVKTYLALASQHRAGTRRIQL